MPTPTGWGNNIPQAVTADYQKHWPGGESAYAANEALRTSDPNRYAAWRAGITPEAYRARQNFHQYLQYSANQQQPPQTLTAPPQDDSTWRGLTNPIYPQAVPGYGSLLMDEFRRVGNNLGMDNRLDYPNLPALDYGAKALEYSADAGLAAATLGGSSLAARFAPRIASSAFGQSRAGQMLLRAGRAITEVPEALQPVEGGSRLANYARSFGGMNYGNVSPIAGIRNFGSMLEMAPGQLGTNLWRGAVGATVLPQLVSNATHMPGAVVNRAQALQDMGASPWATAKGIAGALADNTSLTLPVPAVGPALAKAIDVGGPYIGYAADQAGIPVIGDAMRAQTLDTQNPAIARLSGHTSSTYTNHNPLVSMVSGMDDSHMSARLQSQAKQEASALQQQVLTGQRPDTAMLERLQQEAPNVLNQAHKNLRDKVWQNIHRAYENMRSSDATPEGIANNRKYVSDMMEMLQNYNSAMANTATAKGKDPASSADTQVTSFTQ